MITFEPHPSLPNRIVARSEKGAHLALIVTVHSGHWHEVRPFVRWIQSQTFATIEDAQNYILSCATK